LVILKELLEDWGRGTLGPARFARLWLTCFALLVAVPLTGMFAVGILNILLHGELPEPSVFIGGIFILAILLIGAAMFNISMKRGRDIGWSGTLTGLAIILLFLFGGVPFFLTILLAFVPSDAFGRSAI
jgi:chromate transport protein ChrA